MDPLVLKDLTERVQEILDIMADYEEELYLPFEIAQQLQERLLDVDLDAEVDEE